MDDSNYSGVMSTLRSKDPQKKVKMFREFDTKGSGSVPDPWYSGRFDEVFDIVDRTIKNMIEL